MSDFITGMAGVELESLAENIAVTSRICYGDALGILLKIGFYEERYGAKPQVFNSIVDLANKGCSPERIFACIKLLPRGRLNEYQTISPEALKTARKVLNGESIKPEFLPGKRAVDL